MPVRNFSPSYKIESPYRFTPVFGNFMGYYYHRRIDPQEDDILAEVDDHQFVARPDLIASAVYGDPDLWWVFGVRNGLEDPVHDIKYGMDLWIPPLEYIRTIL